MTPTLLAITILATLGAGFGAGWAVKPDASVAALEQNNQTIAKLSQGNRQLVAEVQRVALEEAARETLIADKLTETPPQCLTELGGDPMSPQCAWAWCVRDGESNAQRCQEAGLQALLVARWQKGCPDE